MSHVGVRPFWVAILFIASSAAHASSGQTGRGNSPDRPPASKQESEKDYADRVRKAPALTAAKTLLELQQRMFLLDMVRQRPNTTITVGQETVTGANVEEYARRLDRERQILIDVIRQRGSLNIAGVYELRKDPKNGCGVPAEVMGPYTIDQNDFNVELKEPAKVMSPLKGIIVESSLAAEPLEPGLSGGIYFVGQVSNGQIELGISGSGIACTIGMLVKRDQ